VTNAEILAQVLSEATGQPLEVVRALIAITLRDNAPSRRELPEADAQQLLAKLRDELPGIRAWALGSYPRVEVTLETVPECAGGARAKIQ